MKILTLQQPGKLSLGEAPEPDPPAGEQALVRVHRIGVCGTDIHAYRGRQPFFTYPRVLGHELGVEILKVGSNHKGLKAGDRCSVEPYLNCGKCIACRRGKPNCCTELKVMGVHIDGGHRELIHVPVHKLHRSEKLNFEQLALVETLGVGAHAVVRAEIEPGETVLVIGSGPIGLSVIQFAQAAGARVMVMDIDETRLAFCRDTLGVRITLQPQEPVATAAQLAHLNGGEMPTAVFDATGHAGSMASAFHYPAHGGRLVFVGLFQGDVTFNDPSFHKRELTLLGSRNARPEDFTRIIGMVENGVIDTTPWITHRAPLESTPEVFPHWTDPKSGVLKAMIEV